MNRPTALLFNVPRDSVEGMLKILVKSKFLVHPSITASELKERVAAATYRILLMGVPAPELDLKEFFHSLRSGTNPNRASSVILIVPEGQRESHSEFLGRGANVVLSDSSPLTELEAEVARLTKIAPRIPGRIMVRLKVGQESRSPTMLCQALNLSSTGMFLASTTRLPKGTVFGFEITLPDTRTAVRGEAEVVRHSTKGREGAEGLGIVFRSFSGAGFEHLQRFLEQGLQES